MSVLVAAAVLFYIVENRPQAKSVVAAKPAATSQSPTGSGTAHRAAAKHSKPATPATVAPVHPAAVPLTVATPQTAGVPDTVATQQATTPTTVETGVEPVTTPPTQPPTTAPGPSLMGTLPRTD